MERIITSLRTVKLTKDIRRALVTMERRDPKEANLSNHLLELYREEWIGAEQYIYMETRLLLNRFCLATERLFPDSDVTMGVYFFDAGTKRLWVGAGPNAPASYNEYANGLSAIPDIVSDGTPEYTKTVLPVNDVDSCEHFVSLNHRRDLLKAGIRAFCSVPLVHDGRVIGHVNMYSARPKVWSPAESRLIESQAAGVERRLLDVKERFVRAAAAL